MNVRISEGNKPFHRNMVCVYCHGDISDAAMVCAGCGVASHADCKTAECPTIACTGSKDKLQSKREKEYLQLAKSERRRAIRFYSLMILPALLTVVAFIGVRGGMPNHVFPWSKISDLANGTLLVMFALRAIMHVCYEVRLERLCEIMIEDDKTSQSQIARLRSGQPEKKD